MPASPRRRVAVRDRVITALARMLAHGFFRSVEAEGPDLPPGPVILAASHLNGFVDPVILVARLGAFPRFLAKATLWDVPGAGPLLGFGRVIPVKRRQDSDGEVDNATMFSAAVEALRGGGLLAVFPEGTTHDDSTIRPLRTGVARIAVQAAADGVTGLHVVPVGVTYEDKVVVRGRALVTFGEPIPVSDADPAQVRSLTDRLQASLEAVTPNFRSAEEALALTAAARITLGTDAAAGGRPAPPTPLGADADASSLRRVDRTAPGSGVAAAARAPVERLLGPDTRPVPLSRVAAAARRLGAADAGAVDRLVSLVARYQMLLASVGLDDDELGGDLRIRTLVRRLVVLGVLVVLLAPLAVAGLFANLVPVTLVLIAGLVPNAPVTKGTVRLLVALVAFPATWTVIALRDGTAGRLAEVARDVTYPIDWFLGSSPSDRGGTLPNLAVFVVAPLLAAVALLVAERLGAFLKNLVTWRTLVDRRGQLPLVRDRRADVVAATTELLREAGNRA